MDVIRNTWIEKFKKKKEKVTESAYENDPLADTYAYNATKKKRFTTPSCSSLVKTLRGLRK